jgi:hypothetical protein
MDSMKDLQLSRRQVLKGAGAVGVLGALGIPTAVFAEGGKVRWDIISVNFATGTLSAGGIASARANDNSKITFTGSGTFTTIESDGVTGGGKWWTFNPAGTQTATGTYQVKRLVSWTPAPGTPPLPHDAIGDPEDESAGLAVMRIGYSDGSRGVLTVSCHLNGTSDAVFEGITTTKGYIDYWNKESPPAPPGNADRTNFHVLKEDEH